MWIKTEHTIINLDHIVAVQLSGQFVKLRPQTGQTCLNLNSAGNLIIKLPSEDDALAYYNMILRKLDVMA